MLETWQGNGVILRQMLRYLIQQELAKGFCNVLYFLEKYITRHRHDRENCSPVSTSQRRSGGKPGARFTNLALAKLKVVR